MISARPILLTAGFLCVGHGAFDSAGFYFDLDVIA